MISGSDPDLNVRKDPAFDSPSELSFETSELREMLEKFLNKMVCNPCTGKETRLGNFQWGVYAFFDYDNEPIYVGQTKESLRTRIRRHLTNQRTDAVAMNVLDPFEVYKIVVYPLPQFEGTSAADKNCRNMLDALEYKIFNLSIESSRFKSILNEKEPPTPQAKIEIPTSYEGCIVSEQVEKIRNHPDVRIARRTQTISRLAQVISERKVQKGLRKALLTQAKRLTWLAEQRLDNSSDEIDND